MLKEKIILSPLIISLYVFSKPSNIVRVEENNQGQVLI